MAPPAKVSIATPAIPRPAASVIVVNAKNEVLLVHRNPKSTSFAGAHVFPGGNYDAEQDDSFEMTAIRELFEETGLLLSFSNSTVPSDTELNIAREEVHARRLLFRDFLAQHKLTADIGALQPFTRWISPPTIPRRFDARFYVAFLPAALHGGFSAGAKRDRIPTPDGAREVVAARFLHPAAALAACAARTIALMPPQAYLLTTLAEVLRGDARTDAQCAQVRALARGAFGRMVLHARALAEHDARGRVVLTYEGDERRGGAPGRLHRSLVKLGPGGVVTEVEVQRNFDVFTEIEEHLFSKSVAAKL
ncbi:NUDIX hydrolase domain-like protein [Amylocystis lapponica]|nr:NUDIX hydrolase domain-like protein [Amylocystis lapponica]